MKTVYQRIMHAAAHERGLRLSDEDVEQLSRDQAIITRAELDAAAEERGCDDGWHEALPLHGCRFIRPKRCPTCGGT